MWWQDLWTYIWAVAWNLIFAIPAILFGFDRAVQFWYSPYREWRKTNDHPVVRLTPRLLLPVCFIISSFVVFHKAKSETRQIRIDYDAAQEHRVAVKIKLDQFQGDVRAWLMEGQEIKTEETFQAFSKRVNAWVAETSQWIEQNLGASRRNKFDTASGPEYNILENSVHNAFLTKLAHRGHAIEQFILLDVWDDARRNAQ